jgi:gas vesicle protein
MGTIKRLVRFTSGSLIGGAVGTVTATLLAPQSGRDLQRRLHDRIRQAQLAGATAKAEKEDELITRFRGSVSDPTALEEERVRAREEVAAAVQAVGLGLNAPGAIAGHDANRLQ